VLIWGVVLRQGGKSVPKLYWTPARDVAQAPFAGRYQVTDDLSLSSMFWQDLTNVLGLLVATNDAEFVAQEGRYSADRLEPFIRRVRELVRSSKTEQWNATTRANVLTTLGNALTIYVDQSGRNEPLQEAIALHGEALKLRPRGTAPLFWAATQNRLGDARNLGQRESPGAAQPGGERLSRRVAGAHARESAAHGPEHRTTLATRLESLGSANQTMPGSRRPWSPIARRCERTREKVPLAWATTQNNLGNALRTGRAPHRHAAAQRSSECLP
jgi:hypothetical protein